MRSSNSIAKWLRALGQLGTVRAFEADVFQAQVEELKERVDGGAQVAVAADLAERAVERLDGVGGLYDLQDLRTSSTPRSPPMHRQVFQTSQATLTPAPDVLVRRISLSETAVNNILGQVRARLRTLSESQQTGGLAPATHNGLLVPAARSAI